MYVEYKKRFYFLVDDEIFLSIQTHLAFALYSQISITTSIQPNPANELFQPADNLTVVHWTWKKILTLVLIIKSNRPKKFWFHDLAASNFFSNCSIR